MYNKHYWSYMDYGVWKTECLYLPHDSRENLVEEVTFELGLEGQARFKQVALWIVKAF